NRALIQVTAVGGNRYASSATPLLWIAVGTGAGVPSLRVGEVHQRGPSPPALSYRHRRLAESSDDDLALQGRAMVCTHKERCFCVREGSGRKRCARNTQRAVN